MPFVVFLTADAARDLEELHQYIALHDEPGKAEHVLTGIEKALGSLAESPERGAYPKELLAGNVNRKLTTCDNLILTTPERR
jgi:toxin ParE1/3/4